MKNSNKHIRKRREEIITLLKEHRECTVQEIAFQLKVSEITVRRDLITLHKMGLIIRSHGKAMIKEIEDETENDTIQLIKQTIARKAAEFVTNDTTVFINTSTTALASVEYFDNRRVNIITNNVKIVNMELNPLSTVILSGGEIRFPKESLVGDIAIDSFSKMSSNISIIGCSGISKDHTITTPILHEAKINSLLLERTKGIKILVADYRKIGVTSNFVSGCIKNIDYLITDTFADTEMINEIEALGVHVIQVSTD